MRGIAFTYDLSTAVGQTRLYAGDTDPEGLNRTGGDRTRTDEEIAFLLAQNGGDARLAAAEVLESKAAEFASHAVSIRQGTLAHDYRQRAWQLRQSATVLRGAAGSAAFNAPAREAPFSLGDGGTMTGW